MQLLWRKCCIVGKFGVLWGRKIMRSHNVHHVIHRQHRKINRRQASFVNTHGDAVRFCDGFWSERRVRLARGSWMHLPLAGGDIRSDVQLARPIASSRRRSNGVRTITLFSNETNRNRQSGADSFAGDLVRICQHRQPSSCYWGTGSSRNQKSRPMERITRRETPKMAANSRTSAKSKTCWFGGKQ